MGDSITGGTTHAVINPPFAGLGSALDVFTTGTGTNGFQTANGYPLNGPYNSFLYSDTDLGRENYYAASIYNVSAVLTEQKHFNESPVMGLSTFCGGITDYWYNLVFSFPATVTKPTNYVHYDDDCFIINGPTTGGSSFPND